MRTRTELLVFLTIWCATLQLVVSVQTKNGLTCSTSGIASGCTSSTVGNFLSNGGTWCFVDSGWNLSCPSGSSGGNIATGCWDWCGYKFIKTGDFGSCATKPNGDTCGAASGRKQETYKCVDHESKDGDKCSGIADVTYVDCVKTVCPCGSARCAAATFGSSLGIQCTTSGLNVIEQSGFTMTNGCTSTIPQGCQNPCDCGPCSTSSTSSGKHFSSSALFFCLQFSASTSRCTSF
jgi:hypothetical protein